jgi:hypothetical protein
LNLPSRCTPQTGWPGGRCAGAPRGGILAGCRILVGRGGMHWQGGRAALGCGGPPAGPGPGPPGPVSCLRGTVEPGLRLWGWGGSSNGQAVALGPAEAWGLARPDCPEIYFHPTCSRCKFSSQPFRFFVSNFTLSERFGKRLVACIVWTTLLLTYRSFRYTGLDDVPLQSRTDQVRVRPGISDLFHFPWRNSWRKEAYWL